MAVVAQRFEKRTCDQTVIGPIPGTGRINLGEESEKAVFASPSLTDVPLSKTLNQTLAWLTLVGGARIGLLLSQIINNYFIKILSYYYYIVQGGAETLRDIKILPGQEPSADS